ncbi:ImcF-related N-terminal domain-containing protein [Oceanospirillum multiglobuliferum]|uniref:Type VI secretion system component TssM1 N-terminal domain-containing protein n=1 Tax=Oceanospirillum multiglobuliferum TaxID=64969 RepID=A0A1T4MTH9_9GAMM|nr:type VI secretion protein IcmF/TssM N-terminal domain-containing protein [Oceanospirillum multiglobuliferum]OPX56900.1 hypothetical protein BTE48_00235 [Oceanospirillum multiglobuliferum]SJZ70065.1 ImcF-related N-terminal domain-containing protein [Oceanospirillum multiglobuliferum]
MKTFLRVLFYILIWFLIFVIVIGVGLFLGFSPEQGALAGVGLFAAWVLYRLIKRLLIRLHAKGRIKQLIRLGRAEEAESAVKADTSGLERRFTHVLRFLKRSPLTHASDPLYQLPWSLVLSGKEQETDTLVQGGRLVLPSGHKEIFTGNECQTNWWLHNGGVIVQAPVAVTASSGSIHPEWGRLLELLSSKRPAEPITHVVVNVSLLELISGSEDSLYQKGLVLRERLDQLIQTLKVNAPVYLVFTELDQLQGGKALLQHLPENLKKQALGQHFTTDLEVETELKVLGALDKVTEQLKQLNLELMGRGVIENEMFLLPNALNGLKGNIRSLISGVFQNSVFQASPVLRGVYWMGVEATDEDAEVSDGLFVQDFFMQVLPNDRGLTEKIPAAVRAERWIKNLWVAGFLGVSAMVWLALVYAYVEDKSFIDRLKVEFAGQIVQRSDLAGNINNADQLSSLITQLDEHHFFPWLDDSSEEPVFISKLKAIYVDRAWNDVVMPIDRRIERALNKALFGQQLSPEAAAQEIARYVGILVREINILQGFLAGKDLQSLSELPPLYQAEDRMLHEELAESELDLLNQVYLQMLVWASSTDNFDATLQRKQRLLKRILADHPDNLDWLINWGNTAGKSDEVRLADFWQGSLPLDRSIRVAPAFTLAGKEKIDDFIQQILASEQGVEQINALIPGFKESYQKRYLDAWQQFALNFYKGSATLSGPLDWQSAIDSQATSKNPFFNLLNKMAEELAPFSDMEEMPDWLFMVNYYQQMLTYSPSDGGGSNNGPLAKLALKIVGKAGAAGKAVASAGKSAMKTQKKLGKGSKGGGPSDEERLAALEQSGLLLSEYIQLIESVVFNSAVRSTSFTSISTIYAHPDDPAAGETALAGAYGKIRSLHGLLGKRNRQNEAFWAVFSGPTQLFRDYMTEEAACELQDRWENRYLAAIQGVPAYKKTDFLYGEGGQLWGFRDAELSQFVKSKFGAGYVATRAAGQPFPLKTELMEYLSRGDDFRKQQQSQYTVLVKAQPTSANAEASYLPQRTLLELQCDAGVMQLENLNFAKDKAFIWDKSCNDTTLLINIGRYTLEKRYPGAQGFALFLKDFQSGLRRFVPADFPILEDRLVEYKVKYIDVRYQLRGHRPVIATLAASELEPPRYIAQCWSPSI